MTQLALDIQITESPEFAQPGDHDVFAHYARKADITMSLLTGVKIQALCGKVWRPSRDYTRFPVCPECKAIYMSLPAGDEDESTED